MAPESGQQGLVSSSGSLVPSHQELQPPALTPSLSEPMPQGDPVDPQEVRPDDATESPIRCDVPEGWEAIAVPYDEGLFSPWGAFDGDRETILVHGMDQRIWRYSTTGKGDPEAVTTNRYGGFQPSPDGRWIVAVEPYAAKAGEGAALDGEGSGDAHDRVNRGHVWVIDVETGGEERLDFEASTIGDWRLPGRSFFFANRREGIGEYDLVEGTVRWWIREMDLSRDYRATQGRHRPGVVQVAGLPRYFTTDPGNLSPDGQQLLLGGGWGSHNATLFRLDLRTESLYVYPNTETFGTSPVWHPDGRHALFDGGNNVLDVESGEESYRRGGLGAPYVDVSPDGWGLRFRYMGTVGCWLVGPMPEVDG